MATSDTAPRQPPSIALMTFVLQEHHCIIVEDWLRFLAPNVTELIVHLGPDPRIHERLAASCATLGVCLKTLGPTDPQETTLHEEGLLTRQFDAVTADFGCVVRLDTLPFAQEGLIWLDDAFDLMRRSGARFITGSTLPYRADRPLDAPGFCLTQRLSNCFLVIAPETWRGLQSGTETSRARYGRYYVEGAAEDVLARDGLWGLRLLNRPELRIFHCQEWGERLLGIRDSFRKGRRIGRFLRGYQDDLLTAEQPYYMYPLKPLPGRIRRAAGRWRRKLWS